MVKKTKSGTSQKKKSELAKKYKKLTARQHVLHAPDTYIGAVEKDDALSSKGNVDLYGNGTNQYLATTTLR